MGIPVSTGLDPGSGSVLGLGSGSGLGSGFENVVTMFRTNGPALTLNQSLTLTLTLTLTSNTGAKTGKPRVRPNFS